MNKKEFWRVIKYLLLSVSAGIIQIAVFTLTFSVIKIPQEWLCNLIALVASVVWNFTLNRKFTFQSANNIPVAMLKVAAFYCVFAPFSAWSMELMTAHHWNAFLAEGLTMVANFVLEFLYYKFVVFRGSIDTAAKEK